MAAPAPEVSGKVYQGGILAPITVVAQASRISAASSAAPCRQTRIS